ncbi:DDE superfamily endonuclease [Ceratobasidium sp. AG-Ba]|nr:DDE superfamily endonuclease [Ceratobasidium sp. AG-Ba]QRW05858.1 DDE superfamily endonuclease [Ceratobasidium sp. AG-Ba]
MYNRFKSKNRIYIIYSILSRARRRAGIQLKLRRFAALVLLARFAKASKALNRQSSYRHLLRAHLLPLPRHLTPWTQIQRSNSNQAYLANMGLDVASFNYILHSGFEQQWNTRTIFRRDVEEHGHPRLRCRSLSADGALGLLLYWITSTSTETALAELFAIVPSVVCRYIHFAIHLLVHILRRLPESQVTWPTPAEMANFAHLINRRHPAIDGAFGFIDGLSLPAQTSSDPRIQEATYNGWHHSRRINNILVFAPTGCVITCKLNAPGSWHDARVAQHIYPKLMHQTPQGYFLIGDSAFKSDELADRIHTPIKAGEELPEDRNERIAAIRYSNRLTQARQPVEWGMRAMQGVFSRLRVPLDINDPVGRQRLLEACVRLHNLRVQRVGINQIRSVYVAEQSPADALRGQAHRILCPNPRPHNRIGQFFIAQED